MNWKLLVMRYARRIRGRRIARRINRKRARKIRTFKLEKRKLGLSGQLVYAGLPERKKMFLTSGTKEMQFYHIQGNVLINNQTQAVNETVSIASIPLNPAATVEFPTLWSNNVANWDKLAVSRIYIKIMPTYNNYTGGGVNIVPQFAGYYVIGDTTTASTGYSKVKQLINFDGSKPFTVLLEKPSVVVQYGAAVHRSGTYLSLVRLGKPANKAERMEEEDRTYCRRNPPPEYSDEEDGDEGDEDVDDWGDEKDDGINNHYGNFVISLDNPGAPRLDINSGVVDYTKAITLRYKVFYKVHLRG